MAKKRVLVVDDVEIFCKVVKINLEKFGDVIVDIATEGKQGIKLAKRLRPDLILLDVVMPGMDGLQVLKKLKEDPETMPIPVVMLTAATDAAFKTKAERLYNEEYITKPINAADLNDRIKAILDGIKK